MTLVFENIESDLKFSSTEPSLALENIQENLNFKNTVSGLMFKNSAKNLVFDITQPVQLGFPYTFPFILS